MTRHRTDEQVTESARQIQEALGELAEDQVAALVTARRSWRSSGRIDQAAICDALIAGLQAPAAAGWDEIFVRRARSELSVTAPSVAP